MLSIYLLFIPMIIQSRLIVISSMAAVVMVPALAFAQFGPTASAPYSGTVLQSSNLISGTNLGGSSILSNATPTTIQPTNTLGSQQGLTTGVFPNAAPVTTNPGSVPAQDYGNFYSNNPLQGTLTTIMVSNILTSLPDLNTIVPVPANPNTQSGGGGIGGGGGYYYPTANNQTAVYVPTVTMAPLRPKTKSDNVKVLQWVLAAKGVYKGTIDGSYGPKTKTAVAAYQKASGSLKPDGYAGMKTLTHMGITVKMQ